MITEVALKPAVVKALRKLPEHVVHKLRDWVKSVKREGLEQVRKLPGYHDEPLKGQRAGQRSIRLTRAYRAIYVIRRDGSLEFVSVEEVHKHEY
jgi:proteic killer suppression protein